MRFTWLLVLAITALVSASLVDRNLFTKLILMAVVVLFVAWAWSRASVRRVTFERRLSSQRAHAGDTVEQLITLRNESRLPKLWLEFRDHSEITSPGSHRIITLHGKQSSSWSFSTLCTSRGRYLLGPASIHGIDPFGLFGSYALLPGRLELTVYPLVVNFTDMVFPSGKFSGGRIMHRRTHLVTPAVSTIREYVAGDSMNKISWNATARFGKMMVKEFDPDPQNDIWIIVNLADAFSKTLSMQDAGAGEAGFPESLLTDPVEMAVAAAASLARAGLNQRRSVGMMIAGRKLVMVPPEQSERQFLKIMEELAVSQTGGEPFAQVISSKAGFFRRHNVVAIVTPDGSDEWVDIVAEWRHRGVTPMAAVVDTRSFGHDTGNGLPAAKLVHDGIPFAMLRRGVPIANSFAASDHTLLQPDGKPVDRYVHAG